MKVLAPAALAAIEAGNAIALGAVEIEAKTATLRWFGGYGTVTVAGRTFTGIGDNGLVTVTGGSIGGAAAGITLTLSGLEPAVLEMVDPDEARDAPVAVWRFVAESGGAQILGAEVFARGRIDKLERRETPGGAASIEATVETAVRGLSRRGGRLRTDADQRLIDAADGGLRHVSFAGQQTLNWGGKPSGRTSQVLPGVSAPYGGGGVESVLLSTG